MEPDARCMMNAVIVTVPHTRETLKRVPLRPSAHVFLFPNGLMRVLLHSTDE